MSIPTVTSGSKCRERSGSWCSLRRHAWRAAGCRPRSFGSAGRPRSSAIPTAATRTRCGPNASRSREQRWSSVDAGRRGLDRVARGHRRRDRDAPVAVALPDRRDPPHPRIRRPRRQRRDVRSEAARAFQTATGDGDGTPSPALVASQRAPDRADRRAHVRRSRDRVRRQSRVQAEAPVPRAGGTQRRGLPSSPVPPGRRVGSRRPRTAPGAAGRVPVAGAVDGRHRLRSTARVLLGPMSRSKLVALLAFGLAFVVLRAPWFSEARAETPTAAISRSGLLGGASYLIEVPANWQGGLVVFAHGIQRGPGPGAVAAPPIASHILAGGHAWIASGYRAREYQPHLFIDDLIALRKLFLKEVGRPRWTIIYGQSM